MRSQIAELLFKFEGHLTVSAAGGFFCVRAVAQFRYFIGKRVRGFFAISLHPHSSLFVL